MLVFSFQPSLQELTLTLGVNGPFLYRFVIVTFLSVYFQGVLQVERKLGGRLLDQPKQILFQFGGGNLCLSLEELGPGWRCKLAANYQVSYSLFKDKSLTSSTHLSRHLLYLCFSHGQLLLQLFFIL